MKREEIKEKAKEFCKHNIKVHEKRGLTMILKNKDLYDLMTDFHLEQSVEVDINSKRVNPDENMGWNFDYDFVLKITRQASLREELSMEQADSVLLALSDIGAKISSSSPLVRRWIGNLEKLILQNYSIIT